MGSYIPCSHYCKFLKPSQQRRIIHKVMRLDAKRLCADGVTIDNLFTN